MLALTLVELLSDTLLLVDMDGEFDALTDVELDVLTLSEFDVEMDGLCDAESLVEFDALWLVDV